MHHGYIGDEYVDLINIFTYGFKDLPLTNIDNRISWKDIVNRYLKEKDADVFENLFDIKKSIKNLTIIDDKINMFIENYEPKTKVENEDTKKSC